MSNLKPLTFYYFSIDGRLGLAHVDDGKSLDSDMHYESYLRSISTACLSDVERLIYTFRSPGLDSHQKLSCLYSIKNIVESDVSVVCCDSDGRWFRHDPEKVSKILDSLFSFYSADSSEDIKSGVTNVRSFLSSLDVFIEQSTNDLISSAGNAVKEDK